MICKERDPLSFNLCHNPTMNEKQAHFCTMTMTARLSVWACLLLPATTEAWCSMSFLQLERCGAVGNTTVFSMWVGRSDSPLNETNQNGTDILDEQVSRAICDYGIALETDGVTLTTIYYSDLLRQDLEPDTDVKITKDIVFDEPGTYQVRGMQFLYAGGYNETTSEPPTIDDNGPDGWTLEITKDGCQELTDNNESGSPPAVTMTTFPLFWVLVGATSSMALYY